MKNINVFNYYQIFFIFLKPNDGIWVDKISNFWVIYQKLYNFKVITYCIS